MQFALGARAAKRSISPRSLMSREWIMFTILTMLAIAFGWFVAMALVGQITMQEGWHGMPWNSPLQTFTINVVVILITAVALWAEFHALFG
jgi:hypothetical protein